MKTAQLLVEHHECEGDVELTYVIVNPTASKGVPANRWDPGCEPSVEWDACYLKGDPLQTDLSDDVSLAERIEQTLWTYFEARYIAEEEAYYAARQDRLNG